MAGGATPQGGDEDGAEAISNINVTPLVDIMLVLLIIFMVTAKLIVDKAITVKTPKKGDIAEMEKRPTISLSIDATGALFAEGSAKTPDEMNAFLEEQAAANPDVQAVISAEATVPHGEVVRLIDTVRSAKIVNFALTVEEQAPQPAPIPMPAPGAPTPGVPAPTPGVPAPAPAK